MNDDKKAGGAPKLAPPRHPTHAPAQTYTRLTFLSEPAIRAAPAPSYPSVHTSQPALPAASLPAWPPPYCSARQHGGAGETPPLLALPLSHSRALLPALRPWRGAAEAAGTPTRHTQRNGRRKHPKRDDPSGPGNRRASTTSRAAPSSTSCLRCAAGGATERSHSTYPPPPLDYGPSLSRTPSHGAWAPGTWASSRRAGRTPRRRPSGPPAIVG